MLAHSEPAWTWNRTSIFFAISSNGMNTTPDLCNRALFVRIKKRTGYAFPIHAEGLLSDHATGSLSVHA